MLSVTPWGLLKNVLIATRSRSGVVHTRSRACRLIRCRRQADTGTNVKERSMAPPRKPAAMTGAELAASLEDALFQIKRVVVGQERLVEWGPVFANVVLADEINRAPAKVQSALLEVMAERQVSIAGTTRRVPEPFLVLATQNPIESEGVYSLPEAQRDRFLMHIQVGAPSYAEETAIAERMSVS